MTTKLPAEQETKIIAKKIRHRKRRGGFFRTVYSELLVLFISVIVLAMLLLGMLLGNMFNNQYIDQTHDQLLRQCERISELMNGWSTPEQRDLINSELRLISRSFNASIWIIEKNGDIMNMVDPINTEWVGQTIPIDINTDYITEVLENAAEIRKFGELPIYNERMMTTGRPWEKDGIIQGGIFVNVRLSEITETMNDMSGRIMLAACIAIFFSVVAISIVAHRLTSPLAEMNRLVKSYAKGDFSERFEIRRRDEIGQLATSVNAMAEDLEGIETMRRSFVANVSHELKSPLASMRGFLQAILEGAVPQESSSEYMQIVYDETIRLNNLINDLLDLSKIESGQIPLVLMPFDVNELIVRTVLTFEQRIEEQRIEVDFDFESEHCMVYADMDRITQVFRNLIDNAVKYAGRDSKIHLASRDSLSGEHVEFEISDNGNGIAPEDLPHLWERFYKADKVRTPGSAEGTGLGLSIVKQIIYQHNCEIHAESELGKGTKFVFDLPKDPGSNNSKPAI